jgi:hypothetical protein
MVRAQRPDSAALILVFTLALLVIECLGILGLTQGHFSYALDDAYIHLSLARQIAQGHYGLDASRFASPSSSIVWPFLLAGFARVPGFEYLPLVFNSACALAFGVVCQRSLEQNLGPLLPQAGIGSARFFAMLSVLVTNVVPSVFLGLEHTLQLLLSALAVRGVGRTLDRGQPRLGDFWPFIVGPLVRYENWALVLGAALFLGLDRKWRTLGWAFGLALVGPVAFGIFLTLHGEPPLPTSVYAKSPFAWTNSFGAALEVLTGRFADALVHSNRGFLFGLCAAFEVAVLLTSSTPRGRRLAWLGLAPLLAHLFFGDYGRYELYLWTFLLLLGGLQVAEVGQAARGWGRGRAWALSLTLCVAGAPYLGRLGQTPFGAKSIFFQQGTLAKLSRGLGESVAANDIGLISWLSPWPVLDLWGLASYELLRERKLLRDPNWMENALARRGVRFAMIYDVWFSGQVPSTWIKVGELAYRGPLPSTAERSVSLYARGRPAAEKLRAELGKLGPGFGPLEVAIANHVASPP